MSIESGDHQKKFITPNELTDLRKGAKKTRNPIRNELLILMLYRHGLRESELCNLKLGHLILDESKILIHRIKNGLNSTHPIEGDELRLIKRYLNVRSENGTIGQPYLFISEQGTQLHRNTVINVLKQASRLGGLARVSPHQLRHGCGYALANKGVYLRTIQNYLGHKSIANTEIYTAMSGSQFKNLWD